MGIANFFQSYTSIFPEAAKRKMDHRGLSAFTGNLSLGSNNFTAETAGIRKAGGRNSD
jgi:hypothetical protein